MRIDELALDDRLKQGLAQLNFTELTLVQEKAIPLALDEKKDIVARAKTGSGKTGAYVIPIIQSILEEEKSSESIGNRALILVPSRELADQVFKVVKKMSKYCDKIVQCVNIAQQVSDQVKASQLASHPSVIVATPAGAIQQINAGHIEAKDLKYFVIDEADLVLEFGHGEDLKALAEVLPVKRTLQTWLMSATLSDDVTELKTVFCRSTAILKLEEDERESAEQLVQYYSMCGEFDKFLILVSMFKMGVIKGKSIVFVNDVDRCYRLKLLLDVFGIKAATLNAELPIASRLATVEQFNKNLYKIIIATDEADKFADIKEVKQEQEQEQETDGKKDNKKDRRAKRKDKQYGVSRGIDFQNVAYVINFDLPVTSRAYTHRIGRTARGKKSGTAFSLVVPEKEYRKHPASSIETAKNDEKVIKQIVEHQESRHGAEVKLYQFDMKQIDSLRYRVEDAFRSVTRQAVRQARDKEFRQQLITSEKLTRHFEENPEDKAGLLQADEALQPGRVQPHLKRVPEYLLPQSAASTMKKDLGFVGFKKTSENRIRKIRKQRSGRAGKSDPLKSFKSKRK